MLALIISLLDRQSPYSIYPGFDPSNYDNGIGNDGYTNTNTDCTYDFGYGTYDLCSSSEGRQTYGSMHYKYFLPLFPALFHFF